VRGCGNIVVFVCCRLFIFVENRIAILIRGFLGLEVLSAPQIFAVIGDLEGVRLRRRPSDFGYDPMINPTLCPISFTALKSKFSPRPMAFAVDNGRKRTSSGSSRRVLSATGKCRPRRGGMACADRC
jgi:hypothetical protein